MKASKIKRFKEGKGIKHVTRMPGPLLKFKGKHDSKKAESAATSYCEKLLNRCQAYENKEIISAEEILYDSRRQAAQILAGMSGNHSSLKVIPGRFDEKSATDIRANLRNSAAKNALSAELKSQLKTICEINEEIITVNSTLEQRINKTRNLFLEKVNLYIVGLRSGGLKDFEFTPEFNGKFMEEYLEKHKMGDSAIKAKANQIYTVEEDDET